MFVVLKILGSSATAAAECPPSATTSQDNPRGEWEEERGGDRDGRRRERLCQFKSEASNASSFGMPTT